MSDEHLDRGIAALEELDWRQARLAFGLALSEEESPGCLMSGQSGLSGGLYVAFPLVQVDRLHDRLRGSGRVSGRAKDLGQFHQEVAKKTRAVKLLFPESSSGGLVLPWKEMARLGSIFGKQSAASMP
jgi:hypothetical protein